MNNDMRQVLGSNPNSSRHGHRASGACSSGAEWALSMSVFRTIAGIAQLGERQTEDLKVTGSIPVGGKAKLGPTASASVV